MSSRTGRQADALFVVVLACLGCRPEAATFGEVCEEAVLHQQVCTKPHEDPDERFVDLLVEERCKVEEFVCPDAWKDLVACGMDAGDCYFGPLGPVNLSQVDDSCRPLFEAFDACAQRRHEADLAAGRNVTYPNWIADD